MNKNSGVRRPLLWLWLPILVCQILLNTAWAADQPRMMPVASSVPALTWTAAPDVIRQPVAELYTALAAMTRAGQELPFEHRYNLLAPVIDRVFDLNYVLKASVGRGWPALSEASRSDLAVAFRRFTVATYVANFDKDAGQRFEILPELREAADDQIVPTRIVASSGGLIRLDYLVRRTDAGWRVVDILLDGTISRVAVQRSDFRALLGQDEANSLIGSLRHKTADLSGGSLGP
jgi:phospholipid transport system substrate-binding protein